MGKRLFIGYATKTGSTKETAEAIGEVLRAKGLSVDVLPLAEAGALEGYEGYVVGAPVNGMAWAPEALAFVRERRAALAARPTAFFLLSIAYGVGREGMRRIIPARLDPASAVVAPVAAACFGGVARGALPLPLRLAFGIKKDAPRDGRNWDEIRAWAEELARKFA